MSTLKRILLALGKCPDDATTRRAMALLDDAELAMVREWATREPESIARAYYGGLALQETEGRAGAPVPSAKCEVRSEEEVRA